MDEKMKMEGLKNYPNNLKLIKTKHTILLPLLCLECLPQIIIAQIRLRVQNHDLQLGI